MALGVGIIAVSAMGTIAWKNGGSLWRAQSNIPICHVTDITCPDGTVLYPKDSQCNFDRCPQCGNWVLDPGESCEVGVCCASGVCNATTCVCDTP